MTGLPDFMLEAAPAGGPPPLSIVPAAAPREIPPFAPGVFYGMLAEHYHAIEAMSASGGKKMLKSPQHYRLMRTKANEPTAAMIFGSCVHVGVLEPDTWAQRVVVAPEVNKRTNAGKDELAAFEREHADAYILSPADYARAQRCAAAVRAHPGAAQLLTGGERELSLFWNDARYGVPCKSRDDIFSHGGITDLKTCQDASPEGFGRQIANLQYHVAAAHYVSGHEHAMNESPRFYAFIAAESEEPFGVATYVLPGNAIMAGAHLMSRALERYAAALAAGVWPGYPDTIDVIQIPKYALRFTE